MKTLQEIKDQIAIEIGKKSWSNMLHNYGSASDSLLDLVAKRYAIEVAKEALNNASERDGCIFHENRKAIKYVAQELVLDKSNIPQL